MSIAIIVFMLIGIVFAAIGVLGVIRMPDVYGRLQASTCLATMSTICITIAGILYAVSAGMSVGTYVKLGIFLVMILLTNPISNHALCKAAYIMGVKPAKPFKMDDYGADFGTESEAAEVSSEKEEEAE